MTADQQPQPEAPGGQEEQDWHAKYLALGTAVSHFLRVADEVKAGQADGYDYWTAHNEMTRLVSEALCWRDEPELYAAALARQALARLDGAGQESGE